MLYKTYKRADHGVIYVDDNIFIIGGSNQAPSFFLKSVRRLDLQKRDCFEEPPMNKCRSRFSLCVLNGYIYAIGGMGETPDRGSTRLRAAERFSLKDRKWEVIADMNEERYHASCCSCDVLNRLVLKNASYE